MGSFNTTCFASQQTIIPGAKCLILPISQQSTFDSVSLEKDAEQTTAWGIANTTCHPSCFWSHAGPIVRGTYYDYGCYKLEDSSENMAALTSLFKDLLNDAYITHQGENECHEIPFNMQALYNPKQAYTFEQLREIWDKVWEATQENRLFIQDHRGTPRPFQFATMHEKTAQYLIDTVAASSDYRGQSFEQKAYLKAYVQSKIIYVTKLVGTYTNKRSNDALSFFWMQLARLEGYRIGEQEGTYLANFYDHYNAVQDILDNAAKHKTDLAQVPDTLVEALFEVFKPQLDHRYLHTGLDRLNIKLSPTVYAGQDYDNSTGNDYLAMITAVNAAIKEEVIEQYGEDEDEAEEEGEED